VAEIVSSGIISESVRLRNLRRVGGPTWPQIKEISESPEWDGIVARFPGEVNIYMTGRGQSRRYEAVGPRPAVYDLLEKMQGNRKK
jgi:hypothetical protein